MLRDRSSVMACSSVIKFIYLSFCESALLSTPCHAPHPATLPHSATVYTLPPTTPCHLLHIVPLHPCDLPHPATLTHPVYHPATLYTLPPSTPCYPLHPVTLHPCDPPHPATLPHPVPPCHPPHPANCHPPHPTTLPHPATHHTLPLSHPGVHGRRPRAGQARGAAGAGGRQYCGPRAPR